MWKKNKTDPGPHELDTLIGEGTLFEGVLRSKASVRIQGQFKGDIECGGDIILGEQGTITSNNIQGRNVVIAGTIQGNLSAVEKITLTGTGRLYGNMAAKFLVVQEGAVFKGTSIMTPVSAAPIPLKEKAE